MGRVIGIDLGTTNSCVAVMEGSEPIVIPNSEGSRTTPSIVAITDDDERLVGQIAKRQAITNPENTVFSVKRLIGRKFGSEQVERFSQIASFKIVEAPNGDVRVKIRGSEYTPQEISAMILQRMKQTAEDYLGEQVSEAVITVPAYFDDAQKRATKDAGKIAGLEVLRLIPEPTAASLAYGLGERKSQKIAVYDLGGGTFDISILEIGDGIFEVISTRGNTFLGGDDFDRRIIDYLAGEFQTKENIDLREDRMALQRLKEASEKVKCELSTVEESEVNLPFITADETGPKHLNITMTREKLESLVEDLVDETFTPWCEKALEDANLSVDQIDNIILVGGQTRMPLVRSKSESFFGQPPHSGINPDEVVAVGAAIQGGVLTGEVKDILLLDVIPISLGIETLGGVFTRVIERNTTIPTKKTRLFSTTEDNQSTVAIHVLQGERELVAHNKSLQRFELQGIPPAPRGVPQVEVTFSVDANGILGVSARDLATKREQTVMITASSGLTDREIEEVIRDARSHEAEDQKRREIIQARNSAETLIYTTQKGLAKFGSKLDEADLERINDALADAKKALEFREVDKIVNAVRELREASIKLSQVVYVEGSPEAPEEEDEDLDDGTLEGLDAFEE
ncbi:molecular chaperone DnaK [bacterium]|nr:molecular chaperone DnaK [candidate division CSSED10-310 bacterium]